MLNLFKNLFGDKYARQIKRFWPIVEEINELQDDYTAFTDDELRAKTDEFRATLREAVGDIEARQAEIKRDLKTSALKGSGLAENAGGDGQAASGLTLEDRQALNDELDDLDEDWLEETDATLDDLRAEAFALVKEVMRRFAENGELRVAANDHDREIAALRGYPKIEGDTAVWPNTWTAGGTEVVWNMVPYDVQLIGGLAIHEGNIAEMKTGEGKTLVGVAPVFLNALVGRGVHVVTVNPYLAQRDMEWMAPILEFLGLTVDVIDRHQPSGEGRRAAYASDVTYGTNNEFGFDYLRDNSFVSDPEQLVQRGHHYAIVDEVDSVLIDEARTPLIISGPVPQANDQRFAELRPPVDKLVHAQKKLVASYVAEADRHLKARDEALEAGDNKRARAAEEQAGLAILRASRGFPKNGRLRKLLQEPGIERLLQQTEFFYLQDNAKRMPEVDAQLYYAVDEKQYAIGMTEKGRQFTARDAGEPEDLFILPDMGAEVARIEKEAEAESAEERIARIDEAKRDLYAKYSERAERLHAIEQLLRAYTLYEKDIEYIVQEGKVQLVDKHTGRVLPGRRYSDGLHQAIEAKENVQVQAATQTYATVTLQNYFRMYHKLAGMTGTAETEAEEFFKIYKLDTVIVPTNKPIARDDMDDLIFRTRREKYNAVLDQVRKYHEGGQPVLVGTTSVEVSEMFSRMLKRAGIPHNVLNAKAERAQAEAEIVAGAGKPGAVTIATNMAGRGTDIKLAPGVLEAGGLAILGTERHDSRRIDLQLRGRAGRQGDVGESQFYVSLEDNLMRLFGPDRVAKVMDKLKWEEGDVITHPWVNKSIERAQKKVEQNNFAIRKRQLEYDDVLNAQREVIYDRRSDALHGERLRGDVLELAHEVISRIVGEHFGEGTFDEMREELLRTLAFDYEVNREEAVGLGEDGLTEKVYDAALAYYQGKRDSLAKPFYESVQRILDGPEERKPKRVVVDFTDGRRLVRAVAQLDTVIETEGQEVSDALERAAMLSIIDEYWTEHLRGLDEVKEGVGLRAYGQRDPLIEYKMEAFRLFKEMIERINDEAISFIFRAGPLVNADGDRPARRAPQQRRRLDPSRAKASHASAQANYAIGGGQGGANATPAAEGASDPSAAPQPVVSGKQYGRNDTVTIQNPATGVTETLKYKYAEKKIQRGWSLVEE